MNNKVTLTGTVEFDNGATAQIVKETTVDYQYAIVMVNETTNEILDSIFTKSYKNIDPMVSKMAREWGYWRQSDAPIHVVSMKRPSKFRALINFTPEQIALIEQTLGMTIPTTEVPNAA